METFFGGVVLGLGITCGVLLSAFLLRKIRLARDFLDNARFVNAGFTWEENSQVQRWLSRDPGNDDWILWDPKRRCLLRLGENDGQWQFSGESKVETLALGSAYQSNFRDNA